jgi:transcriptional regulator with XRE-family HTH domain
MTQEQLGDRVKLSRTSIVNIEKGRQRIAAHQLCVFAEALKIAPVGLLPERPNDSWVAEQLAESADRTIVQWAKKLE